MSRQSRRRVIHATVGLGITGAFLWIILKRIDMDRVLLAITQVRWYILPLALTFLAAGYAMRVTRWWWLLRACGAEATVGSCVWPLIVSVAVNNVIPFRMGDVMRAVGFRVQLRSSTTRVLATLLIERILDTTVLLVFLVVGISGLEGRSGNSALYTRAAFVAVCAILIGWAAVLLLNKKLEEWLQYACRHRILTARGIGEVAERHIHHFFTALSVVRRPGVALGLLGMSVVVWVFEGAVFQTVAWGLSYHGRWIGPWFAFASGTFSTLLPSSPGYVGTFDFFAMAGLMAHGANRSLATAFAFLVHVVLWLPLTAAGLAYMVLPMSRTSRESLVALAGRDPGAT